MMVEAIPGGPSAGVLAVPPAVGVAEHTDHVPTRRVRLGPRNRVGWHGRPDGRHFSQDV